FSYYTLLPHPNLHSFPTRRSSDLKIRSVRRFGREFREKLTPANWRGPKSESRRRPKMPPCSCDFSLPLSARDRFLPAGPGPTKIDRKSTRLNSSHVAISYAVFCLK